MSASSAPRVSGWKVLLPCALGLGATAWLLWREWDPAAFEQWHFGAAMCAFLGVAALCMAGRDVGYMARIRLLSQEGGQKGLTWAAAFRVIMLWEFASAVTPGAIGGTSVALFFINREGVPAGRAAGMVLATSFLDELYFAVCFPLVVLLVGYAGLFADAPGLAAVAWTGYAIKLAYILLLSYGLFVNPSGLRWLLLRLFSLPLLRRLRGRVEHVAADVETTANEYRGWGLRRWAKAFLATILSWTSRYWVVNALVVAFFGLHHLDMAQHMQLFGKQLAMWIMMLVVPTPGGAGFAEWIFAEFLGRFIPAGAAALALCWRLVSYYPYLVFGALLLPRWAADYVGKKTDKP